PPTRVAWCECDRPSTLRAIAPSIAGARQPARAEPAVATARGRLDPSVRADRATSRARAGPARHLDRSHRCALARGRRRTGLVVARARRWWHLGRRQRSAPRARRRHPAWRGRAARVRARASRRREPEPVRDRVRERAAGDRMGARGPFGTWSAAGRDPGVARRLVPPDRSDVPSPRGVRSGMPLRGERRSLVRTGHARPRLGRARGSCRGCRRHPARRLIDGRLAGVTNVEYAVTGDGTHIAYRVYESDPACDTPRDVVLVTGGFIPLEIIDDETGLARLLDGLRGIGRVLVFDRRGVGQSDPVTDWDKPILEQWSDDLAAVIDATGAHDVLLVGFEGYGVASRYAALHPEN